MNYAVTIAVTVIWFLAFSVLAIYPIIASRKQCVAVTYRSQQSMTPHGIEVQVTLENGDWFVWEDRDSVDVIEAIGSPHCPHMGDDFGGVKVAHVLVLDGNLPHNQVVRL